jgi:DNA-binding NarL/FixJ family response regulator
MAAEPAVWLAAMQLILCGEVFHPAGLLADLVPVTAPDPEAPGISVGSHGLTGREIEVLAELSRGASNRAIAHDLGISEHTVKLHVHHILTKLPVQNRTGAANWYHAQDRRT